jgi:hypothetical protein
MATFDVSDRAGIAAAMQAASSGDVIRLADGAYPLINIGRPRAFDPANPLVIEAANRNGAVLAGLVLKGWAGLTVRRLRVATDTSTVIDINGCKDILIDDCRAGPSVDNRDPWDNGGTGVRVSGSERVVVQGCDVSDLYRGMAATRSKFVSFRRNRLWQIREGIIFAAMFDSDITENEFSEFWPRYNKGEHPDAIQFWNNGEETGCHRCDVRRNTIVALGQRPVQGIFITTQRTAPEYRHSKISVAENLLMCAAKWGICLGGVDDALVELNTVLATNHSGSGYDKGQDGGRTGSSGTPCISFGDTSNGICRNNLAHWFDKSMQRADVEFYGNRSSRVADLLKAG